jgi:hypothetical protein
LPVQEEIHLWRDGIPKVSKHDKTCEYYLPLIKPPLLWAYLYSKRILVMNTIDDQTANIIYVSDIFWFKAKSSIGSRDFGVSIPGALACWDSHTHHEQHA